MHLVANILLKAVLFHLCPAEAYKFFNLDNALCIVEPPLPQNRLKIKKKGVVGPFVSLAVHYHSLKDEGKGQYSAYILILFENSTCQFSDNPETVKQ